MTDLSVIIVSYNVRAFLEQCLVSVQRASEGLALDVWVVDNHSVDGSVEMFQSRFPEVHLIANEENVGFSKANNQAIRESQGRHVLLLNPDTVVREDTFRKCLAHAEAHPQLGGMGVPMYDGTGKYLPESKRGLPTPWAALCRMTGLHKLAPRSEALNAYYAGHVQEHESAPVDILSGAYMWMRREALDEVGLLDEQFFMYGEDIDLSWRLVEGGWENHYCAETSIIHYKGESTKKGSLNYVMVFYRAMLLFAAKHFEGRQARAFSWMIRSAIYFRAALAILRRAFTRWGNLAVVTAGTLTWLLVTMLGMQAWGGKSFIWPEAAFQGLGLVLVQIAATLALGGYRDIRASLSFSGHVLTWLMASMLTLVVYALWPEAWRFSRAAVLSMVVGHAVIHGWVTWRALKRSGHAHHMRRLLVSDEDTERLIDLLRRNEGERTRFNVFALWPSAERPSTLPSVQGLSWIGSIRDLQEAVQIHNVEEVVFSGRDVRTDVIVEALPMLGKKRVTCRIAWTDVGDVMSSGGASRASFVAFQQGLHRPEVARSKRVFDVVVAAFVLLASPLFWVSRHRGWPRAAWQVLLAQRTWVSPGNLQSTRPCVWSLTSGLEGRSAERKAFTHAQDYHWRKDAAVVADALISRRAIISHGHH
ncbi:MAG: glycosyltransferase [Bacteroidota bacterium]|nr:glycosyltransferase [Bacteroidota bacterium]